MFSISLKSNSTASVMVKSQCVPLHCSLMTLMALQSGNWSASFTTGLYQFRRTTEKLWNLNTRSNGLVSLRRRRISLRRAQLQPKPAPRKLPQILISRPFLAAQVGSGSITIDMWVVFYCGRNCVLRKGRLRVILGEGCVRKVYVRQWWLDAQEGSLSTWPLLKPFGSWIFIRFSIFELDTKVQTPAIRFAVRQ